MASEIKQKIVLEGEKEYTAAIKAAQRNLKTLRSELKAETAELGANATAQQKNAAKIKSLKQQIQEQEKIVKTYKEGLAEVREKYGDNADAVAQWEQRLNGARATLANMRNSLDTLGDGMGEVNNATAEGVTATRSFAEALGTIGSVGETVSGAIESIFTGVIDSVRDTLTELWDLISSTAAKANRWTDISNYWNTDAQTIQQWDRAVSSAGKSFEDLQSAVSRIVLGGKGEKITELLGVSDENYKDQWEYAMAVMDQINLMKKAGKDMTPIYETLFGEKKSQKVMDLINGWDFIRSQLEEFNGNTGDYGMSDEELNTMDGLWVKISTLEEKWDALKAKFAAGFGTVTLDLMTNAEGALDAIAKFLNAEDEGEREQALEEFKTNITQLFEKVAAAIREALKILEEVGKELEGSDDPVVSAIGSIMKGISEALQWIVNNQEEVKKAFEVIFGAWLIAKLAAVGAKLASIVANIAVIKTFSAGGAATTAATTTAAGVTSGMKLLPAIGLNTIVAAAVMEGVKAMPADFMTQLNSTLGLDTEAEHILDDVDKQRGINTMGDKMDDITNQQAASGVNPFQTFVNFLAGGGLTEPQASETKEPEETPAETDNRIPGELQGAAEAYWDAWRALEKDDNAETQAAFSEAWDNYAAAFAGQSETMARLDELMGELMQEHGDTWTDVENLPASWFNNKEGLTSSDVAGFRGLPAQMLAAVKAGASSGVSGIQVSLDGYTVGRLVAPYVSQTIARDII